MKAPIKKLQGNFRFQVLMRIVPEREDLTEKIFIAIDKYNGKGCSVYLEINPNNLN